MNFDNNINNSKIRIFPVFAGLDRPGPKPIILNRVADVAMSVIDKKRHQSDEPKQSAKRGRTAIFTEDQDRILMENMAVVAPGKRSQENSDRCKQLAAEWGFDYLQVKSRYQYLNRSRSAENQVRPRRFTFTKEQDDTIVRWRKAGKNYNDIAAELGLQPKQVRMRWNVYLSKDHSIKPPVEDPFCIRLPVLEIENHGLCIQVQSNAPKRRITKEEDLAIVRAIEAHYSYARIAAELQLEVEQVKNRWCKYLSKKYPHIKYEGI